MAISGKYALFRFKFKHLTSDRLSDAAPAPPPPIFYGMPYEPVDSIAPDLSAPENQWPPEYMAKDLPIPPPTISPPPPEPDTPENVYYPLAPTFHLVETTAYRRGYVYACDFDASAESKAEVFDNCTKLKTPPSAAPTITDGKVYCGPIRGMTQMPPGIPFIVYIDGDRSRPITIAVMHTLESMDAYPEGVEVRMLSEELLLYIFGRRKGPDTPELPAFYNAHLKQNLRSGSKSSAKTFTGSFSLASTKGEGEGNGIGLPAMQYATPTEQAQIATILKILHKLYRLIVTCSLSKNETDQIDWNSNENNVFTYGGLSPGLTSCQGNVSSGIEDLWKIIGLLQGYWHLDKNDCIFRWTFLVFLFRLPPGKLWIGCVCCIIANTHLIGSDPGPFMLGRHGLYVRELDVWIVFLFFKGTDMHAGSHPTYTAAADEEWKKQKETVEKMWEMSINRVALVCYPSSKICSREAPMSVSPPLHFGNGEGAIPISHKAHQLNFAHHSRGILGDTHDFHNRLAREGTYAFLNHLKHLKIKLNTTITDMMEKMTYEDEEGKTHHILAPPIDLDRDEALVIRKRGHWAWFEKVANSYRVRMTKANYASAQERLAKPTLQEEAFTINENSHSVLLPGPSTTPYNDIIVTKILDRHFKNQVVSHPNKF